MHTVHPARVRRLKDGTRGAGPVIYWMSRDQRAHDNWALIRARECAEDFGVPLIVVFCLSQTFLGATRRQYDFMLRGLAETAATLKEHGIAFTVLRGAAPEVLPAYISELGAAWLVTDFDPLRIKQGWQQAVASAISIPFEEVDAHNVVPCRYVSDKQEYAARTIRPKIHRNLDEFLDSFPALTPPTMPATSVSDPDFEELLTWVKADEKVASVPEWIPGTAAGHERMDTFISHRLRDYHNAHNDPNVDGVSSLSPYLHFGHISAQRVALEVISHGGHGEGTEAFLEQLIVRRELTDNFCLHNPHYDRLEGAADWAKKTLDAHRDDTRPYIYSRKEFENANTHSALWNAAQMQMVETGYMHNYMRMFWAKKILEWSASPEEAMEIAVYLNDRYQLDGRDPNGYVGVIWSIAGIHDRGWKERSVFGSIRYMNERGCRRKFDVDAYIETYGNPFKPQQLGLF